MQFVSRHTSAHDVLDGVALVLSGICVCIIWMPVHLGVYSLQGHFEAPLYVFDMLLVTLSVRVNLRLNQSCSPTCML